MLSDWAAEAQTAEHTSVWVSRSEEGLVLWVTDEQTLGDHGLTLFSDGRVETK
jgi:hypothetical protein